MSRLEELYELDEALGLGTLSKDFNDRIIESIKTLDELVEGGHEPDVEANRRWRNNLAATLRYFNSRAVWGDFEIDVNEQ